MMMMGRRCFYTGTSTLSRVNIIYKSSQPNKLPVPPTKYTQQKPESEVYKVNTLYTNIYATLSESNS